MPKVVRSAQPQRAEHVIALRRVTGAPAARPVLGGQAGGLERAEGGQDGGHARRAPADERPALLWSQRAAQAHSARLADWIRGHWGIEICQADCAYGM